MTKIGKKLGIEVYHITQYLEKLIGGRQTETKEFSAP